MTEFKLPELGENIESGDLVRLMISPGTSISEGQPVMELETDKAVVEVPSSVSGTIKEVRVKEGDKLKVGQVIFTVENGAAPAKTPAPKPKEQKQAAPAPTSKEVEAPRPQVLYQEEPSSAPPPPSSAPVPATPAGASEFVLPELGENIDQGDLVRLMISVGARVSEGQPIMELETDKAVVEVPSSVSGVVREIKVKEGQKIKVGQVIFTLETGAAAAPQPPKRQTAPVEHVSGQQAARMA